MKTNSLTAINFELAHQDNERDELLMENEYLANKGVLTQVEATKQRLAILDEHHSITERIKKEASN